MKIFSNEVFITLSSLQSINLCVDHTDKQVSITLANGDSVTSVDCSLEDFPKIMEAWNSEFKKHLNKPSAAEEIFGKEERC